jgi:hypothetical protein
MKTWIFVRRSASTALFASIFGCGDANEVADRVTQMAGTPSADQVLLDPLTIPKFAHELPIPRVFAPTIQHHPLRREYTISVKQTTVQMFRPRRCWRTAVTWRFRIHGGRSSFAASPGP